MMIAPASPTPPEHEKEAAIAEAAEWLARTTRKVIGPMIPALRSRFGFTATEAVEVMREARLIRERRGDDLRGALYVGFFARVLPSLFEPGPYQVEAFRHGEWEIVYTGTSSDEAKSQLNAVVEESRREPTVYIAPSRS